MWSAHSHVLDDAEPAAWPEETPRFSQDKLFIGCMAQAFHGPDHVKTGLGERDVRVILLLERYPVSKALLFRIAACTHDLARYGGDSHNLDVVGLRQPDGAAANATTGIKDALP